MKVSQVIINVFFKKSIKILLQLRSDDYILIYFQVLSMLLPSIFHASVCRLLEESASTTLPETVGTCRKIVSRIAQIFRNSPLDLYQYEVK